ncbi:hypothetical protein [Kingella oralis]|uniref:hypothetical protein n=1 Tax=Kingella oralis TaxID=505 RepID=UPI0028E1BFA2|nr:hypothetical protein [Kingella oralis]
MNTPFGDEPSPLHFSFQAALSASPFTNRNPHPQSTKTIKISPIPILTASPFSGCLNRSPF